MPEQALPLARRGPSRRRPRGHRVRRGRVTHRPEREQPADRGQPPVHRRRRQPLPRPPAGMPRARRAARGARAAAGRQEPQQDFGVDLVEPPVLLSQPAQQRQQVERVAPSRPGRIVAVAQIPQEVVDQPDVIAVRAGQHPAVVPSLDPQLDHRRHETCINQQTGQRGKHPAHHGVSPQHRERLAGKRRHHLHLLRDWKTPTNPWPATTTATPSRHHRDTNDGRGRQDGQGRRRGEQGRVPDLRQVEGLPRRPAPDRDRDGGDPGRDPGAGVVLARQHERLRADPPGQRRHAGLDPVEDRVGRRPRVLLRAQPPLPAPRRSRLHHRGEAALGLPGDQGRAVAAGPLHRHRRQHAGQGSEGVGHRAVRDLPQPRRRRSATPTSESSWSPSSRS